ncbi:hypothetical protein VKT23_006958 [Stygiomarasmius scandens]|uniref:Hyaluronan/mRNA-binding protein domain-containing protein n=1 Tax=Marasmiellus scandens TaxID=2682957 RepID=A0ABR1JRZ5_9AGAR
MSVASRNPFALLDEGSRPASPPPKASAPPAPVPQRGTAQKSRGGPASRGGKYYARGGGARSAVRDSPAEDATDSAPRKFDGERGRGRGRGGGRGAPRGGRRQFDRHSATGKTDSDKKIHQGWGGDDGTRELQDETIATVDAAAEAASPAADTWGAEANASADAWGSSDAPPADGSAPDSKPEGRPRREEEEDNTLTLDQYMAQQKEKELGSVPKLETRKANEGTDGNIWKDVVPLEKSGEDAYFVGKGKAAPKARAKKEEKVFLEIDARFERPSRGGPRGRGGGDRGRGGGRGRGRGGANNGRTNGASAATVNVDDETAFPSLS